jgi:hypothetical protein
MRQAIVTKYLGPTGRRGARVVAYANAGKLTVPWEYAWGIEDNHAYAARTLAARYGWTDWGTAVCGALPYDKGFCFVSGAVAKCP